MPFTPFHFGPGLFAKSLASRQFSWMAFVASQIVIDVEPLYYMVRRTYPVHRFFHTFVGTTLAAVFTLVLLFAARHILRSYAVSAVGRTDALWPSLRSELSNTGLMMGALVGGISHPFLDGIMHRDIRPFAPWTERNPLLAFVDLPTLHVGCLLLGTMGFTLMAVRLYRERLRVKPPSIRQTGSD